MYFTLGKVKLQLPVPGTYANNARTEWVSRNCDWHRDSDSDSDSDSDAESECDVTLTVRFRERQHMIHKELLFLQAT